MTVQSGQSVTALFTTRVFSTGVGTNADSLPTGTLYLNGTANGATVTVTNISTGLYKAAVTMPTLAIGDEVELVIAATISTISDSAVVWGDTKDILADASGFVTANLNGDLTATMKTSVTTAATAATPTAAAVTARVTANTDQLAGQTVTAAAGVTFPTSIASPTNITAGTITTATNLTNAPTNGDFTTTMKTSIGTAVAASAVASVTGNLGGNVVGNVNGNVAGSVGSVTARVTANTDQIAGSGTAATLLSAGASSITSGTAITGTLSSTQMSCSGAAASSIDNLWNGRTIIWSSGVLAGAQANITAYNGTTKVLTYLTTSTGAAPSNGDTFDIF